MEKRINRKSNVLTIRGWVFFLVLISLFLAVMCGFFYGRLQTAEEFIYNSDITKEIK